MKNEMKKWLASSYDPTEVSTRVKGIIIACSSLIVFFGARWFNIHLTQADVLDLAVQIGTIVGAIITIHGAILSQVRKYGRVK